MPHSPFRILALGLLSAVAVHATWIWGVPEGGSTMKFLTVPVSARSAALAGSGVASPGSVSEAYGNPLAIAASQNSALGFSQVVFSDKVGASLSSLQGVYPSGNWRFSGGASVLDYKSIDGRDDDGNSTGSYGAGAFALQLGIAHTDGIFSYSGTGKFASQNIDGYHSRAALLDAGVGMKLGQHWNFAALVSNYGWVEPFDGSAETAPAALQAGVTAHHYLTSSLEGFVHADLYRRTDTDLQVLAGTEFVYRRLLSLRIGYPFRAGDDAPSAGVGFLAGPLQLDYAYSARPALGGNHHIGIQLAF